MMRRKETAMTEKLTTHTTHKEEEISVTDSTNHDADKENEALMTDPTGNRALLTSSTTVFKVGLGETALAAIGSVGIKASGFANSPSIGITAEGGEMSVLAETDSGEAIVARARTHFGTAVTAAGGDVCVNVSTAAGNGSMAIKAVNNGDGGLGVSATGGSIGVKAEATSGTGVWAIGKVNGIVADGHTGVAANANRAKGSLGVGIMAVGDEAVVARGTTIGVDATADGTAVAGVSDSQYGGFFSGGRAPIRLFRRRPWVLRRPVTT